MVFGSRNCGKDNLQKLHTLSFSETRVHMQKIKKRKSLTGHTWQLCSCNPSSSLALFLSVIFFISLYHLLLFLLHSPLCGCLLSNSHPQNNSVPSTSLIGQRWSVWLLLHLTDVYVNFNKTHKPWGFMGDDEAYTHTHTSKPIIYMYLNITCVSAVRLRVT